MRSKWVEDDTRARLTSLHAAPPRLPPCMRMPNELLDEVFKHVFAELEREPLRDRVRVYAPLSLVCRAWQRVAVTHAYANVVVDVAKDSNAIAFLDPVGGAGSHLLSLVKSVKLSASEPLIKAAPTGDQGEEDEEEAEGEDSDAPPFRPSPLHGPADNETSTLPIVASLARILARCSNLLCLNILQLVESVTRKITADQDPGLMWPKLTHLNLTWNASFIDFLPVLACLSHMQQLTSLCLLLGPSLEFEDPGGTMTQELVDKHPVRPLERLQRFVIALMAEVPTGSKAVLKLLSPHAPLRHVEWGGDIPPGMCEQLSKGTSQIEKLMFTWMLPTHNFTNELLPQLLELGRRPVKLLVFDFEPHSDVARTESLPPITEVLKNLPYGARLSSTTNMDPSSSTSGLYRVFPPGGADFAAIQARPIAPVILNKKGEWSGSLNGKPILQVGVFRVEEESDDNVNLRLFGRFGDPDVEGDVTDWMLLKMGLEEDSKEEYKTRRG